MILTRNSAIRVPDKDTMADHLHNIDRIAVTEATEVTPQAVNTVKEVEVVSAMVTTIVIGTDALVEREVTTRANINQAHITEMAKENSNAVFVAEVTTPQTVTNTISQSVSMNNNVEQNGNQLPSQTTTLVCKMT